MSQALLQDPALLHLMDMSVDPNVGMAQTGSGAGSAEDLKSAPKKGFGACIMNAIEKYFAPPPGCESAYLYWP